MKYLKRFLPLILIFFVINGCKKVDQFDQKVDQESNYKTVTITETGTGSTTIYAGQTTDAGSVSLADVDTDNDGIVDAVEVTYTTTGDWVLLEIQYAIAESGTEIPMTRKGNLIPGQFPYKYEDLEDLTSYTFNIPFTVVDFVCGDDDAIYAAAHCVVGIPDGAGGYTQTETGWGYGFDEPGNSWGMIFSFYIACGDDEDPPEGCETAFAYYNTSTSTCFLDIDEDGDGVGDFNRWGWSNGPLGIGSYTFDIYAGAGQCDLTKGTLVGNLSVAYDGSEAIVTYNVYGDNTMDETHLYVGNDILPSDGNGEFTVAPGQYGNIHDLDNASTDTYTITGLSGDIYVVAHAVVCGDNGPPPCDEWILYGSNLGTTGDAPDGIYEIDLNAQTRTLVYNPGAISGSQNYPNANAYDPVNERIYFGTDNGVLYYHEFGSGTHVEVATGLGTMACGSWYNGKYYYVKNGTNLLYEVLADGTVTQIGTVPTNQGYGDIVFDPHKPGVFVGSAGSSTWYAYDISDNSHVTLTGEYTHKQLAYGSDGVLYAVQAIGGEFFTVEYSWDNETVSLTSIWVSGFDFTDLASGPQCQ